MCLVERRAGQYLQSFISRVGFQCAVTMNSNIWNTPHDSRYTQNCGLIGVWVGFEVVTRFKKKGAPSTADAPMREPRLAPIRTNRRLRGARWAGIESAFAFVLLLDVEAAEPGEGSWSASDLFSAPLVTVVGLSLLAIVKRRTL